MRMQLLQEQNRQLQEQLRSQQAVAKQNAMPMSSFGGFETFFPGTSNCRPPMVPPGPNDPYGATRPSQYQFAPIPGYGMMQTPRPMCAPGMEQKPTMMQPGMSSTPQQTGWQQHMDQKTQNASGEHTNESNARSWNEGSWYESEWKNSAWSNGG